MKKGLLALLLVAVSALTFGISALGAGTGNLVIHFQKWDGDYTDVGMFSWTLPEKTSGSDFYVADSELDNFGQVYTINNVTPGTAEYAIFYKQVQGQEWWQNKLTDNVKLGDIVQEDKTVHVYVFQGNLGDDKISVYVADPDRHNVLAVYYDPAGAYEEGLGIHGWGWTYEDDAEIGASQWGSPSELFTVAGRSEASIDVWAMMLTAKEDWAGFLIYAGDDSSKKTGDLKPETNFFTNHGVGTVEVVYIVNAGSGVTNNSNVYDDPAEFSDEAFSFKLLAFSLEEMTGTYAIDPRTIVVKTSASVASPYAAAETNEARTTAEQTIKTWFEVKENLGTTFGSTLEIERVDFGKTNTTLNTFVITLTESSALVNTKNYEIFFDLGLAEKNLSAQLPLDLDTEAPVLTFVSPLSFVGKAADQRIIEVPWGQAFDQSLFPRYSVTDNRDGDITSFVFVPKGNMSVLNTAEEGDYTIMLQVEDKWGNVTQETFIFRVVKGE